MTTDDFERRVADMYGTVRRSVEAEGDTTSPVADQILASITEASTVHDRVLPEIRKAFGHDTKSTSTPIVPVDVYAFLLAAISADDISTCQHLDTPRPMFALLTARMVVCRSCVQNVPQEPEGLYDDTCDYCRRTGVNQFTPIVTTLGPMMIHGEACDSCVERLRIS